MPPVSTQYRKKTPPVDVVEFTGQPIPNGFVNIGETPLTYRTTHGVRLVPPGHGLIPTLAGPLPVAPGDKLVTEANGTLFPVAAADFAASYEPVPTTEATEVK